MARRKTGRRDPFAASQSADIATVTGQALSDLVYDYDLVPQEHREAVRRSAMNIKPRLKRAAEDLFVIGEELASIKGRLLHGEYTNWLEIEFGLSERMAQRFVNVRERLGAKSDKLSVLIPSALYMLAAKSTPDEAIEVIEQQIDTGQRIGVAQVKTVITDVKERLKAQDTVLEAEVLNRETVEALVEDNDLEAAKRLEVVLSHAFTLLEGQPDDDWGELFKNSELARVRNEIYQLRETVRDRMT